MNLSALGEFGLIELIQDAIQPTHQTASVAARRTVIGIGDDTAAWTGSDVMQLATTDSLVEDIHFSFGWCTWEELGHKSLAVNLSDIAAMGGVALYALVSLSCPGGIDSDSVVSFYRGMTRLATDNGVVIAGGNLTRSPFVTSSVFVMGESPSGRLLRRASARAGDVVAVTGSLGAAAAALSMLTREGARPGDTPEPLRQTLVRPRARLTEGQQLVEAGVECAIDISDGLLSDLTHICECSRTRATLRASRLPISPECHGVCDDPVMLALSGGEAYELLFTCSERTLERVNRSLDCPVTVIGRIDAATDTPGVVVLGEDNLPVDTSRTGWRHF